MASIETRDTAKGRRYDVIWRDYGSTRRRSRTFRSIEAARRHERDVDHAHDERRPWTEAAEPPPVLTLEACGAAYVADCQRTASAGGLAQIALAVSAFIAWLWDEVEVVPEPVHLTRARLAEFHAWLQTDRAVEQRNIDGTTRLATYRCGVGTANSRVRMVEAWWRWLIDSGDYAEGVIPAPKRLKLAVPPAPPRNLAPTWAEMDAAIAAANPAWARLMTLMRCTGLRSVAQAMRIRRTDVDLEVETLTVRGELGKSSQERSGRTVPITPHLVAAIREWPLCPDGYLVCWDTPSHHGKPKRQVDHDTARRILARAGVRPEIYETRETEQGRRHGHPLHCFRAGFISGLKMVGVRDEETIQALVGHSGTVTTDRYTDEAVYELRKAVARIPPIARPQLATVTTLARAVHRRYSAEETTERLVRLLPPEWRTGAGPKRGAWTWLADRVGVPRGTLSAALHGGGTVSQVAEWERAAGAS